jgi:hypothetical protein
LNAPSRKEGRVLSCGRPVRLKMDAGNAGASHVARRRAIALVRRSVQGETRFQFSTVRERRVLGASVHVKVLASGLEDAHSSGIARVPIRATRVDQLRCSGHRHCRSSKVPSASPKLLRVWVKPVSRSALSTTLPSVVISILRRDRRSDSVSEYVLSRLVSAWPCRARCCTEREIDVSAPECAASRMLPSARGRPGVRIPPRPLTK